MGSKAPKAPDLGPLAAGSEESARIAQDTALEQLAWAKEQDAANRALLQQVLGSQEAIQKETGDIAREDRARYKEMFQPLEENLIQEFQNYGSPEQMALNRGRAIANVNQTFDAQRRNALQRLESYGVDPSQTRNAALDMGVRTQQAAAQAGAANASNRADEQIGRALRAEAINIGKGMPSNVAASYGQSLNAGNSMMGNANQTTATSGNAMQGANSYLGTSIGGFGQAGNTMMQGFGGQMQSHAANQAGQNALLGGVGMAAGSFMADGGDMYDSEPGMIDYGAGDGSGIDDQVPILASKEEYIIPADVVRAKGTEFFDKLVERYHTPAEEQREEEDSYTQNIREGKALDPMAPRKFASGGQAGGKQNIPQLGPLISQVAQQMNTAPSAPGGGGLASQKQAAPAAGPLPASAPGAPVGAAAPVAYAGSPPTGRAGVGKQNLPARNPKGNPTMQSPLGAPTPDGAAPMPVTPMPPVPTNAYNLAEQATANLAPAPKGNAWGFRNMGPDKGQWGTSAAPAAGGMFGGNGAPAMGGRMGTGAAVTGGRGFSRGRSALQF